jgi:hypothetical protein
MVYEIGIAEAGLRKYFEISQRYYIASLSRTVGVTIRQLYEIDEKSQICNFPRNGDLITFSNSPRKIMQELEISFNSNKD